MTVTVTELHSRLVRLLHTAIVTAQAAGRQAWEGFCTGYEIIMRDRSVRSADGKTYGGGGIFMY